MGSLVVLGGYGNFGRRIVAALAPESGYRILIAGRSAERAERLAAEIGGRAEPLVVDRRGRSFAQELRRADAKIVIHTAGPFQGQDYAVPRACIEAGCHYVDLADARTFVCGIGELDSRGEAQ
ncbi:MAG TPA: saccharopine dehydrogenase NADP-binding domain-containing protein [Gammaproteobacteria bacterium]